MNETDTAVLETPVAVETPKSKPASKKPAAKLATKAKAAPTKPVAKADNGRAMAPVPAAERRQALLKLLRQRKAFGATSAVPISKLAERLGYGNYDVYCLAYHKYPLAAGGYVKTVKTEESNELSVYLTAKGQKSGPDDAKKSVAK